MSEFIKNIRTSFTGKEYAKYIPLKTMLKSQGDESRSDLSMPFLSPRLKEYKIGVEWIRIVKCEEKDLHSMLENCIRELTRAVYGDLINHVIELERAVYEEDVYKAREKVHEIYQEIKEGN